MKKLTLIGICLLMALIGVSCVLTAGSLSNNSLNNSTTQSINDQQPNSIQDVVITKTAEVSKLIQNNPIAPKKENKTVVKNTKKMDNTTSNGKHVTKSNKTNQNSTQSKTVTNNTTVKNQSTNSTVRNQSTNSTVRNQTTTNSTVNSTKTNQNSTVVKNQTVSSNSSSSKIKTNTSDNNQNTINKSSNNTQSSLDSQMSRYRAYFEQYNDLDKLIALVSKDHSANETQKIIYAIYGEY